MDKPTIAGKEPMKVNLEKDRKYAWCACGKSEKQPFCSGAHIGTEFKPLIFSVDENKEYSLCMCKQTGNPPFCDGKHLEMTNDE